MPVNHKSKPNTVNYMSPKCILRFLNYALKVSIPGKVVCLNEKWIMLYSRGSDRSF